MALICRHGIPVNYNDLTNDIKQYYSVKDRSYGYDTQDCILFKDVGEHELWGNPDSDISNMNDNSSGIRVRPGHKITTYTDHINNGYSETYNGGESGTNYFIDSWPMRDSISSLRVMKDCTTNVMTWDESCLNPSDPSKYIGNNLQNRKNLCSANLNANSNCYNWCNVNRAECSTAIQNYCKNLDINTMVNDPICSDLKNEIIKDRCTKEPNLFNTNTCQTFCQNNANECRVSANTYCENVNNFNGAVCTDFCKNNIEICKIGIQSYCGNNFNETCKNYCKDKNIEICMSAIKKYCSANTINTDPYCKPILLDPLMRGQHNTEMDIYCNNEGKNDLSKITPSTAKNTFKDTDILTNPICACFDKELIAEKFKYIKNGNRDIYDEFTSRPECWYSACKRDIGVYQKSNPNCQSIICAIDIGRLDIQDAKNIQIENNCGRTALTTAEINTNPIPTNTNPIPTNTDKIDCQMSDWSICSTKCGVGTKTRKKIIEPLNGGKPCDVLVEKCGGDPCKTLKEQLLNGTYNFNDLDQTNKIILIVIIIIIIIFII